MPDPVYIAFGPAAMQRIRSLMEVYKEATPEGLIAKAIGLMEAAVPYLDTGALTVVDTGMSPDEVETAGNHVSLVLTDAHSQ